MIATQDSPGGFHDAIVSGLTDKVCQWIWYFLQMLTGVENCMCCLNSSAY